MITQEIVADLDIEIPLRDGITLRGNIHRPSPNLGFGSKFPVVLNYSLYGKDGGTDISIFPLGAGLDRARISSQYVFEAADPAWWCRHGYIVASVDARGSYMSEGDKAYYSRDVGLDGKSLSYNLALKSGAELISRLRYRGMARCERMVERQGCLVRCKWLRHGSVACSPREAPTSRRKCS